MKYIIMFNDNKYILFLFVLIMGAFILYTYIQKIFSDSKREQVYN